MKKLIFLLIACCMVLVACGGTETKETEKQNRSEYVKEKDSESTLKTDVSDFCSDIELFMASFNGYLVSLTGDTPNPDEEMKEDGDGYIKKAKEVYDNKIEKSNYDSVRINDIKSSSYMIISQSEQMWNDLKEGKISIEDYESITEKQDMINEECEKLKSYLE